jgi:hypothetical protein
MFLIFIGSAFGTVGIACCVTHFKVLLSIEQKKFLHYFKLQPSKILFSFPAEQGDYTLVYNYQTLHRKSLAVQASTYGGVRGRRIYGSRIFAAYFNCYPS